MAELNKTDFDTIYVQNSGASAVFKDNTTEDIGANDMRDFGRDIKDSFLNKKSELHNSFYATASGTDTYAATPSPAVTAYSDGLRFYIKFTNANTGPATLNIATLGAVDIVKSGGTSLSAGDITSGQILTLIYESSSNRFQILGMPGTGSGGSISGLTSGRVTFANSATSVVDDSNLYWDNTNKRLSIGTGSSPTARLDITEDGTNAGIRLNHGGANTWASIEGPLNRDLRFVLRDNDSSDAFEFWTNNGGASAVRFEITSGGIVRINTAPTNDNTNTALLARDTVTGNIETVASSTFQTADAGLTSIAGLTTAADRMIYTTASDTYAVATLTSFARTLLDDATASDARSTLGLVIGTNVQAYDAELAAIAGLTSAADRVPYFTGSGTAALATFSSFGRSLVDDADAATARTTLGITSGTYTPTLTNVSNVDASTAYTCHYTQIGNIVTVSGRIDVDATGVGFDAVIRISLPIASNLTTTEDASGVIASNSGSEQGFIEADAANNTALTALGATATVNLEYRFIFTYEIK
jgi:hypothetical protein